MGFEELSPEEREKWNELERAFPPDHWARLDSGDVAQVCRLLVKEDGGIISEDENDKLWDLFIKCGMTPMSRRKFEEPGAEFKPN